jgi:two-component system sensor histidine kinase/response regulator
LIEDRTGAKPAMAVPRLTLSRLAPVLAGGTLIALALAFPVVGAPVAAIAAAALGTLAVRLRRAASLAAGERDEARARSDRTERALERALVERDTLRAERDEAARHVELSLQGSHDGVWEYDLRTRKLYLSPGFRERLGLEPDERFEGPLEWFEAHLHPEDLETWHSAVQAHLDQRASYSLDLRLRTPAGDYRWFRARGLADWDHSGRPVRLSGSLTDITERRFAEARLRESEESFRSLSSASPVGILKTDALGQCEYCNQRWQEITGLTDFEALGEGWTDSVSPEDRAGVLARWAEYVSRGTGTFQAGFRVVMPDGRTRWVRAGGNAISDGRGDSTGFVLTFEDVTGEQLAAQALQDARDKAMQAAQAKSEFLANMSHEIRTPLNGVVGMTQLLSATRLNEEQHDYVRTITTSAESLLAIINDILDFSKIEAGKMQIERVAFDLRTLFEDVAELLAPRARERGLELVLAVEPSLPRRLVGDPTRIRQVLLNLASNAIKFTDTGEVALHAERLPHEDGSSWVRLAVRDTGIGIRADRLGAVFESFTQEDGSTTRKYGGTGLGLTISRQLAGLMGGSIHVDSALGKGSTFWIELPLPPAAEQGILERPCDLRGVRVLVANGHDLNGRMMEETLRTWGATPEVVRSGADALARVQDPASPPVDLVLLEQRLPDRAGLDVARELRGLRGAVRRVVFVLSSFTAPDEVAGDVGEGRAVEAWITRPVREVALARVVARAMGRAHQQAQAEALAAAHEEFGSLHLLLVDDNEINRKVASRMLQKLGVRATQAVNGAEAVRLSAEHAFDLVFMDCMMPEMDGFEATRSIRTREARDGGHVRIVAMTANAMEGDREHCIACGMDDYVAKPVKLEAIADQLRLALAARPGRGERAA